jgi:hypothetical protein
METRTQIVTQLVAAILTNEYRMQQVRNSMDAEHKIYSSDHEIAVEYACIVADKIINKTTEDIVFPERVV